MNFTDQTPPTAMLKNHISFDMEPISPGLEATNTDDTTMLGQFKDSDSSDITLKRPVSTHSKVASLKIQTDSKPLTLGKMNNLNIFSIGSPQYDVTGELSSQRSIGEADLLLCRNFPTSPGQDTTDITPIRVDNVIKERDDEQADSPGLEKNPEQRANKMHAFLREVTKKIISPRSKANSLISKGRLNLNMPQYANFDIQEYKTEENCDSPGIKKGSYESESQPYKRSPKSRKTTQILVPSNDDGIGAHVEQYEDVSPDNIIDIDGPSIAPGNSSNPTDARSTATSTTTNRPQTNPVLIPMNLRAFYEPEANIHLIKICGLCISFILGSISLYMLVHGHSIHGVFITAFCYSFFLSLVDTCWTLNTVGDEWLLSDDVFYIYDSFISSFVLLMVYIKVLNILPFCSFSIMPFIPEIVLFWRYSFSPRKVKIQKTLGRCLLTIQILMITLKLDGVTNWSWQEVLILIGLYLVYRIITTISSICSIIQKVRKSNFFNTNSNESFQLVKRVLVFAWYLTYLLMTPTTYVILYLIAQVSTTSHHLKTLNLLIYLNVAICAPLLLLTALGRKHIVKFIALFGLIDSHLAQQEVSRPRKPVITIQSEKQTNHYFVMLSSTYFRPLHDRLVAKSQESYQKFKSIISDVSLKKSRSKDRSQYLESRGKSKQMQLEDFKQTKTTLDQKLAQFLTPRFGTKKEEKESPVIQHLNRTDHVKTDINQTISQDVIKYHNKNALSFDNLDMVNQFQDKLVAPKPDGEESLCLFCYTNPPDVILMNCGHGGICYECAVLMVKKKDECHECRATVESICKIDPNPKFSNIIKVVELNKLVKTMD